MDTQTALDYPDEVEPALVDLGVAAVFATFPGRTWTEQSLRSVVAAAVAAATAPERRYQMAIERHRWIPFLCRAVAADTTTDRRDLVAHRVGFRSGFVWARLCADVDKVIDDDVAARLLALKSEDWRERVTREPPAKGSWDDLRLFWASDDRSLDEARIAALRAQGFAGRCDPQGYTLEPGDPDCEGVIHLP